MRASDKSIFAGVALVVLAALFWFLMLSPKRDRAAELSSQADDLRAQVSQQEQTAAFGEQARREFPEYYGRLVVLGKAVPEQADSASMMIQLSKIADSAQVQFRGITLSEGSGEAAAKAGSASTGAAAVAEANSADAAATSGEGSSAGAAPSPEGSAAAAAAAVATPTAAATEATAAAQPIGAVVGPAGLSTLPYDLVFKGGFFEVADYLGGLDRLVQMSSGDKQAVVDGRLMTVDGFALKLKGPALQTNLMVTTYVTPPTEGLTAGASPGGPAVPATPQTTPASTVTP